jgi:hypothetical protein
VEMSSLPWRAALLAGLLAGFAQDPEHTVQSIHA